MKNILCQILKIILYPLIYCHQVIMDAPIICCSDEPLGYTDFRRHAIPSESAGRAVHPVSRVNSGWVCPTR